jgi:hypothetical protein
MNFKWVVDGVNGQSTLFGLRADLSTDTPRACIKDRSVKRKVCGFPLQRTPCVNFCEYRSYKAAF